jgi:hypothetical protein
MYLNIAVAVITKARHVEKTVVMEIWMIKSIKSEAD